ncbi:MAG: NeuD/PglB/VioB family sugar acetyltransferase [Vicinamibacteria bacterium]
MQLVLIGGGEHARVVIEAARSRPDLWEVKGFVDPKPNEETNRRLDLPWLGSDHKGRELAAAGGVQFILGLAGLRSREARRDLAATYDAVGAAWATVIHAASWVSPTARLDGGVFVSAGALVNSGARVERHAVINTGAVIEHDVVVGEFAQVSPGATIGGAGRVGRNAYVGLGACVRDHVTVGESATVGMGAVVVAPVPQDAVVIGNPARSRGVGRR